MQLLGHYLHTALNLTVQAINYPGHDQSTIKMPASTWQEWYSHVLESYHHLAQKYPAVSVVGFSTGCPLALYLAAAKPIEKLVLLSPYLAIRHQWYYMLRPEAYLFSIGHFIEEVPRLWLPIQDQQMRRAVEQILGYRTFNLNAVRSANALIAKVKLLLAQVDVPTMIIQPRNDSVVDPAGAEFLYKQLGSSSKYLSWLQYSDHILLLDLERENVFFQVGDFLTR